MAAMLTRITPSATSPGSPKALQRFQNCIAFLWPSLHQHNTQPSRKTSVQIDAMEEFTNELTKKNKKQWEELRDNMLKKDTKVTQQQCDNISSQTQQKNSTANGFSQDLVTKVDLVSKGVISDYNAIRSPQLGLDIRYLSQPQLDNLLLSTLEIKNKIDFLYLIRQCIQWQQLPSNEVLIACLKYLSSLCRIQQIESFADIFRSRGHPLSKTYADLAPFKAMALWRSGSADIALITLQRGYGDSLATDEGRRMIRNAFRTIVEETLALKGEAVMVTLMEVARELYNEYKDIFVIGCIWKQCFASDWFCDQKSAADLFEYYKDLQQLVERRSNALCSSFLSRHNVDAVHRLIELFLQYNQRDACNNCLSLLFNYQYLRQDLRACAEIVKSCSELQMPLCELQNEQFLSLFLNQSECPTATTTTTTKFVNKSDRTAKSYQYKF